MEFADDLQSTYLTRIHPWPIARCQRDSLSRIAAAPRSPRALEDLSDEFENIVYLLSPSDVLLDRKRNEGDENVVKNLN